MKIPLQTRQAGFVPTTINNDARTVEVTWSTGATVRRFDWWEGDEFLEELDVTGANLNRLNAGAPLLNSHAQFDLRDVIGVVERAWITDGAIPEGRAIVRFSDRAEIDSIWQDVRNGILRNISVGYSWDEIERTERKDQPDLLRVVRFTPLELSLVPIPADAGAQVRQYRSFTCVIHEDNLMSDKLAEPAAAPPVVDPPPVVDIDQYRQDGARAERTRIAALDELFAMPMVPKTAALHTLRAKAIEEGWTADRAGPEILRAMATEPATDHRTILDQPARGKVEVHQDEVDTFTEMLTLRALHRLNLDRSPETSKKLAEWGWAGRSMESLMFRYLELKNVNTRGLDSRKAARLVLRAGPHTHSDFTSILANVANKSALKGWTETPTTWQVWCNTGSLADFKQAQISGLSAFSDLDTIPASGGPYEHGTMEDTHETAQLATYGKLFGISRRALIDDDLGLFSRSAMKMGAAAARKVNALAYAVLTGNQTMTEDSTALFHANHSNYIASGSGAAPSVLTLDAGFTAMAKQAPPKRTGDTNTAYLNITPAYLLVPRALETTARVLVTSTYDPAGTTASVSKRDAPNPFQNRLTVVADALLDANDAARWYLAAAQNSTIDTVTVFFLNGTSEPYIEEAEEIDYDGVTYKVRIDAVARALDFRGLYHNDGN